MGPLNGVKVVELGGIGPAPFCGMLLADLGAEVLRIERLVPVESGAGLKRPFDLLNRGKRSVAMDLKRTEAVAAVLRLCAGADALLEGFRPGVTERMGLGPETCLAANPKLVYGRMTGWGQSGPLANAPGHDINYLALSGVLHAIGPEAGPPVPPLNLVADFGGGGMYLAFGLVSALLESRSSGIGQVVDASMTEGSATLMTFFYGLRAAGLHSNHRGTNRYDGGAPYYGVYETCDGRYVALGSNEPRFFQNTLRVLGLEEVDVPAQHDRIRWGELRDRLAGAFRTRTRDEWCRLASGQEVCISPVLSMDEAPDHPHNRARGSFVAPDGVAQPAPGPRFSRTTAELRPSQPSDTGAGAALATWGFSDEDVSALQKSGAVA